MCSVLVSYPLSGSTRVKGLGIMLVKASRLDTRPLMFSTLVLTVLLAMPFLQFGWERFVEPKASVLSSGEDSNRLPLSFEPNAGQTDSLVSFMAHVPAGILYFTPSEVILSLQSASGDKTLGDDGSKPHFRDPQSSVSVVHLQFVGANPSPKIEASTHLVGKVNYLIGNDPSRWYTDVPSYSGITYVDIYPGVDLSYEGTGGSLKGTYT